MKRIIALIVFCGLINAFFPYVARAVYTSEVGNTVKVVVPGCNNNGVCQPEIGEDLPSCPLDCPYIPPTATSTPADTTYPRPGAGVIGDLEFLNFQISATTTSVLISWETTNTSLSVFSWGRTPDYEMGTLSEAEYMKRHQVKIENLEPGTVYYFKIEAKDLLKHTNGIYNQSFMTRPLPDFDAPSNVSNFKIVEKNKTAVITWTNPLEDDFAYVRIVRSPYFYPRDPLEGKVIYEGEGVYVVDEDIVPGRMYYYSAFASDLSGNFSSGAVARFIVLLPGQTIEEAPIIVPEYGIYEYLAFTDLDFSQNGENISFINDTVTADIEKNLLVSLFQDLLSQWRKTIEVSLYNPDTNEELYSFLMRYNGTTGAYEALIDLEPVPGRSRMRIDIYDEANTPVKTIIGHLNVISVKKTTTQFGFGFRFPWWLWLLLLIILICSLILLRKLWIKHRRRML